MASSRPLRFLSRTPRFKRAYVLTMRVVWAVLRALGLVALMDRHSDRFPILYSRSLLAIYDPVDLMSLRLPWWTFSAIDYVDQLMEGWDGEVNVFEYGCGAGTHWLANRCTRLQSIEHDEAFSSEMRSRLEGLENIEIRHVPARTLPSGATPDAPSNRHDMEGKEFDEYVKTIRESNGPFDLIVIDGRARVACLREAVHHLSDRGVILFDNSDRREYLAALRAVKGRHESFPGLAPCLPYRSETTILSPRRS